MMQVIDPQPISVTAGHATDDVAETGCTVLLFSAPALCAVDVRGGAPGTRETDLLRPGKLVQRVDALLLTGGSAFGLAAADGVMTFLKNQQRGFMTNAGPVPIVPAAVIFDLATGEPVAPTAQMGYAACVAATPLDRTGWGRIGAGRGATTAKMTGSPQPGGIGCATVRFSRGAVTAVAVVNALGVVPPDTSAEVIDQTRRAVLQTASEPLIREQTTLVALLVDAAADKDALIQAAVSAHEGMTRAIVPSHTPYDGDLVFSVGLRPDLPGTPADLPLCVAAETATEAAIRRACWAG